MLCRPKSSFGKARLLPLPFSSLNNQFILLLALPLGHIIHNILLRSYADDTLQYLPRSLDGPNRSFWAFSPGHHRKILSSAQNSLPVTHQPVSAAQVCAFCFFLKAFWLKPGSALNIHAKAAGKAFNNFPFFHSLNVPDEANFSVKELQRRANKTGHRYVFQRSRQPLKTLRLNWLQDAVAVSVQSHSTMETVIPILGLFAVVLVSNRWM